MSNIIVVSLTFGETISSISYPQYFSSNISHTQSNILYTQSKILYAQSNILYAQSNILYAQSNILYKKRLKILSNKAGLKTKPHNNR